MLSRSKALLVLLMIGLVISQSAVAQPWRETREDYIETSGWSLGFNIGATDLWGDVGTKSFIDHYSNSKYTDKVSFMGGILARYTFRPNFAVRLMLNYGSVYATDKWNYDNAFSVQSQGDDAFQRYARNQDAKATIFENTVLLEYMPRRNKGQKAFRRGQPFIAAGVSIFHFEPYSTIGTSGVWTKTYDLHLEGQGFKGDGYPPNYNRWSVAVPLGLGYRWDIGKHLNLGIEYIYRITFTDYLDGVSNKYVGNAAYVANLSPHDAAIAAQVGDKGYYSGLQGQNAPGNMRGNPSNKDAYSSLSITFFYKVFPRRNIWYNTLN